MRGIVKYFIKYSISGNILLIMTLIFGLIGLLRLRSTFFPDVPGRNISIQTVYPGASPEEIETSIVLKIEDNLQGVTGIDRVTSNSVENAASILIETTKNSDVDDVLRDVKSAVDRITSFPSGMESINVFKKENIGHVISFSISGEVNLKSLKTITRQVERDLLSVQGISKIVLSGFPEEEITINVDENQLDAYGLTFQSIQDAVRKANVEITGGTVVGDYEELKIRARDKVYTGPELEQIVVKSDKNGRELRLKDVAEVIDGWAETPNRNYFNGSPAASVDISNTNDEDLIFIAETVKKYIEEFNNSHDKVHADITRDSSNTVMQRIDMLVKNGLIGFVLVLVLLAFFLHYRLAFWVALSIPISFAGMFVLAIFFGITLNVVTLFGMITVIGILVDDGVVISENIYRHYENGENRVKAAINGTMEVLPAIFSAILTTMVAFSAFFFIDGKLGDFFSEMAFIVIGTLLFSLIEGIFILPAHIAHSKALKRNSKENAFMRMTNKMMDFLKYRLYSPSLDFALRNKALSVAIPIGIFIMTVGAISGGIIKTTFFPFIESEQITIKLKMPSGTPAEVTLKTLDQIEKAVWVADEKFSKERTDSLKVVLLVDKRVGPVNTNEGVLRVNLLDNERRALSTLLITGEIRSQTGEIRGVEELTFSAGGAFGLPVSIALIGSNLKDVREATDRLKIALNDMADLKDVKDDDIAGNREVVIKLKDKATLLGLNIQDVMGQIRQGFFGGEVQRLQRGLDEVKVWVKYNRDERATLSGLEDMRIRTARGEEFVLSEIASLEIERGVIGVNHMDGNRVIRIDADISNKKVDVPGILSIIETETLPEILADYPDIRFSFEGQAREQGKSKSSSMIVVPVVFALMIAIIILTFRSVWQTIVVLVLIPFSFIGVAWGHWVQGLQISLFSYLGMIALIGIVVNDSLVFVSAFNLNIKRGLDFNEALKDAAMSRFRPILLTTITTVAGLAPLMLSKSFQAQFLIPMAATIAYGLAVGTILLLILLPVFLVAVNDFRLFVHWYWNGKKKKRVEVESAYKELEYEEFE